MRGEIELKPCPFCGGEAALRNFERVSWYVVCKNCDARIDSDASRDEAIDMWTRRASEPGTSVVRWTRYDGTPETLPDAHRMILLSYGGRFDDFYVYQTISGGMLPFGNTFENGDLWAYLPEPPEA